jgi:hypothetical protein
MAALAKSFHIHLIPLLFWRFGPSRQNRLLVSSAYGLSTAAACCNEALLILILLD